MRQNTHSRHADQRKVLYVSRGPQQDVGLGWAGPTAATKGLCNAPPIALLFSV